MKLRALIITVFTTITIFGAVIEPQRDKILSKLPSDIKKVIVDNLIVEDPALIDTTNASDFHASINNIKKYVMLDNRTSNNIPFMEYLVARIYDVFCYRYEKKENKYISITEDVIAQELKDIPAIQTQEFEDWLRARPNKLLEAIARDDAAEVGWILSHGADVDANFLTGYNALLHAIIQFNLHSLKEILKYSPDLMKRSNYGLNAIEAANLMGNPEIMLALRDHVVKNNIILEPEFKKMMEDYIATHPLKQEEAD